MKAAKLMISAALAIAFQHALADEPLEINPYRPSVSNSAQLPHPGQLEFELGGLREKARDGGRTDSLPYLFKLAFSEEWGVLLGGDARVWMRDAEGARERGVGDTTLTLKRAFLVSDETAFGLELAATAPTAKDAIGSGKAEYALNGIYSQDLGRFHLDANLNTTRIGIVEPGTGRMETGLSAALSMPLSDSLTGTAELAGTRRSGTSSTAQFLAAVVYSPNNRYSIDFGVAKGLNSASQDWSFFTGFVVPIAKLW